MSLRPAPLFGFLVLACAARPAEPPQGEARAKGAAPAEKAAPPQGAAAPAAGAGSRAVEIAWNRFYDTNDLYALLRRVAGAHPDLCSIQTIGKSYEGRDMLVLTIHDPKTGPESEKPAIWVDGNVHGNEVQGGEACLYLAWYLTDRHATEPSIRQLLDRVVFYILPSQNPDGRQYWFDAPNTSSSSRSGKKPTDNDNDGLFDEDGPEDLDGDGELLRMRKHVPGKGDFRVDPDDPRRMIRVAPGKTGDYVLLGSEGIDNDGDGQINEDGPGGYDLNRNWPSDWQPNYIQFGAGDYPLSHPEARAIAGFFLSHPNIAAVQSFHNNGGMILRGPGANSVPEYPGADLAVFDDLGLQGEKILPFYRYMVIWRDLYTVHGGFVNWGFEGLGAYAITNEMWADDQYFQEQQARRGPAFGGGTAGAGAPGGAPPARRFEPSDDSALQDDYVFDRLLMSDSTFVPWHKVQHPQFGEVELGGFRKSTSRVPPGFMIEEMLHRNALFCVYHAEQLPHVSIEETSVEPMGDGLHAVTVTLRNDRRMPTRSALAAQKDMGEPDLLELRGDGLTVVAGGVATDRFKKSEVTLVEHEPGRLLLDQGVPGYGRITARFFVRGRGTATVRFASEKAGPLESRIDLP